jgi:hypothetical protein
VYLEFILSIRGGSMAKGKSGKGGGGSPYRSAITGRYVKKSTAIKNPKTTVKESR